jgi:hypothetical protein
MLRSKASHPAAAPVRRRASPSGFALRSKGVAEARRLRQTGTEPEQIATA